MAVESWDKPVQVLEDGEWYDATHVAVSRNDPEFAAVVYYGEEECVGCEVFVMGSAAIRNTPTRPTARAVHADDRAEGGAVEKEWQ